MVFRSLVALLLLTSTAWANDWTMVPERSQLTFEGTQTGAPFQGSFSDFTTEISLNPEDLTAASIKVEIATATAGTGSAERDGALPGADWFDVANHPTASFVSETITKTDGGYIAEGALSIKGTPQSVALPFTLTIEGDEAHATGTLTIDRNDFAVGTGALSPMVGSEVAISFDIIATR